MKTKQVWKVVFKKPNGNLHVVTLPGGLHEAEAVRNAWNKAPKLSVFVLRYKEDESPKVVNKISVKS